MNIVHKGWNWENIDSDSWLNVSEEFLPVALKWRNKFHSILDIGAGKGRHALFFAENGFKVSAVDLSESSVSFITNEAKKRNLTIDVNIADMTNLPYEEKKFDCVICFHTIYHTDFVGVKKAIDEIHRVLNENGEAYITFNSKDNISFKTEDTIDGNTIIKKNEIEDGIPHCYVDEKEVEDLLSEFEIISMSKITEYTRKGKKVCRVHYYTHVKKGMKK